MKYNLEGHNTVLLSAETMVNLHWVATGSYKVPDNWYRSLTYASPQKATPSKQLFVVLFVIIDDVHLTVEL